MSVKYLTARKEYKCSKCGKIIEKGTKYYRGSRNFCRHDVIRCSDCGLKQYEMSTSEYIQRTGYLQDKWQENYNSVDMIDELITELEDIRDSRQDNLDNMPENLRETSSSGETLQEQIDQLDEAISNLENIEIPEDNEDLDSEEWQDVIGQIDDILSYL